MASPLQQQSMRRKLIYIGCIVVLLTASIFLRQVGAYSLDRQASALEMREEDKGDVELTGSAVRLLLTGSRGFAMTVLWRTAMNKQARHEWDQLEVIVNSLTKLQPHFITPWLFQSWNLAYNVSVESDRDRDKYFYIARGIQLLARGERQNKNNPDLRFNIGFYNQHKIGRCDQYNTMRTLFQISCIDPLERDPKKLNEPGKFEEFCQKNPMLVRRLKEALQRTTKRDVLEFLADNGEVPSRFDKALPGADHSPVKVDELERFPVLPPADAGNPSELANPDKPDFDNFQASRDWYQYALKPMPPPSRELGARPPYYDPRKYRMPRYMAAILFRGYPSIGQTYVADFLGKEGWLGAEGWTIQGEWLNDSPGSAGKDRVVGQGDWSTAAWSRAHEMWKTHGLDNGLYMAPEDVRTLEDKAKDYRTRYHLIPQMPPIEPAAAEKGTKIWDGYLAHGQLYWHSHYLLMTNFNHFYFVTQVESDPETVKVRKKLFTAEAKRAKGDHVAATRLYMEALPLWRDIMLAHPDFRSDDTVQEDSYEMDLQFLRLRHRDDKDWRRLFTESDLMFQAVIRPPTATVPVPTFLSSEKIPPPLFGILDGMDAKGQPLISLEVKNRVRSRMGMPVLPGVREGLGPVNTPPAGGAGPGGGNPAGSPPRSGKM